MNIGDFLHSKRWRLIQNYIYSWGASVVLIGALFKLEHLAGASAFLGVGLSIEAIIFFVSAFEPLMENPDWKKVYPQLRPSDDELNDRERAMLNEIDSKYSNFFGSGGGGGYQGPSRSSSGSGSDASQVSVLSKEQIKLLNDSLQDLVETASGINKIASATTASNTFVENLNKASKSISEVIDANTNMSKTINNSSTQFSTSYKDAGDTIRNSANEVSKNIGQSVSELTGSYQATSEAISASGKKMSKEFEQTAQNFNNLLISSTEQLSSSYKNMTGSLTGGFKKLDENSGKYIENIEKMNKNLAKLNAVYEIQLQGRDKVESMVGEYSKGVAEVNKLIQRSIEETKRFNENTKEISDNIQALNKVYGNMLGALNVKK